MYPSIPTEPPSGQGGAESYYSMNGPPQVEAYPIPQSQYNNYPPLGHSTHNVTELRRILHPVTNVLSTTLRSRNERLACKVTRGHPPKCRTDLTLHQISRRAIRNINNLQWSHHLKHLPCTTLKIQLRHSIAINYKSHLHKPTSNSESIATMDQLPHQSRHIKPWPSNSLSTPD